MNTPAKFNVTRDKILNHIQTTCVNQIPVYNSLSQVGDEPGMEGDIILDRQTGLFCYHDGLTWVCLSGGSGGVLPSVSLAGPATDRFSNTVLSFDTKPLIVGWYAMAIDNTNTFLPVSATSTSTFTTGSFSTGTHYIQNLEPGVYDISFSASVTATVSFITIGLSVGVLDGANSTGTPFPHPTIIDRPAVYGGISTIPSSLINIASSGQVTITSLTQQVGLLFSSSLEITPNESVSFSHVQLNITRLE